MADVALRAVTKRYEGGTVAVDAVDLDVADGELLVLVGPSGCGKSTLLRMVAGLEDVTAGHVLIGGRDVTRLRPKDRDIAMVFQSYALYPHMSVRRNLGYPLRLAGTAKDEIDRQVTAIARTLQLEAELDRRPAHLSGGQRQRVAMGRALVRRPRAFLMDEPLSNLDAKLRVEMRAEISRLQRSLGVTTLYVTHDQVEAMTMGERVAVLDKGRLQQVGAPQQLYDAPDNLFVATFLGSPGMNTFPATVTPDGLAAGGTRLAFDRTGFDVAAGQDVVAGLRPEAFADAALDPGVPGDRVVEGTVDLVESLGADLVVHLAVHGRRTVARLTPRSRARPGDVIKLAVDTAQAHLFDPVTGRSLRAARAAP